jgi:hypothetical protein
MKPRLVTIGLTVAVAVASWASCSSSTSAPPGPPADAGRGTSRVGAGAPPSTGGGGGSGGKVDAAVGADGASDAVAGGVDGGSRADGAGDASEAGASDLRPARDAASLPDGPYRYPDPAGQLCGDSKHTLAKSPAEVLVVLDRSDSMEDFTIPPATKWDDARDAVKLVMAANPGIAWGIKLFPTGDVGCDLKPGVEVPTQFGAADSVAAVMDGAGPPMEFLGMGTPTDKAINVAAGYLKSVKSALPRYMVLVTDGIPNCSDEDPATTIKAIADAAAAGFQTFVIGIGNALGADIPTLDKMAVAGGKPRAGMPRFYPAANRAELNAALASITVSITTCVFPLAAPPLDPDYVGVTVDARLIPRDPSHAQGWDYTRNGTAVEIFGSECTDLRSGAAMTVGVHFGCPN